MGEAEQKILLNGPGAFSAWKAENPGKLLDCSGASLVGIGASFESRDLRGIDFSGADFTGLMLNSVNLEGANLKGTNFTHAQLKFAKFGGANLENALFLDASLRQCEFGDASFVGTNFLRAGLEDVLFYKADFSRATVRNASFQGSRLNESNFEGCDLRGADFQSCEIKESNLSRCNLENANFISASLAGSKLQHALLDGSRMISAQLEGSSLTRASLRNVDLRQANLRGATIDGADFYESTVDLVAFDGVKGAARAKNLSTVRFEQPANDVKYFDKAVVSAIDDKLGWERIRGLGRLPLFGASYSALLAIPFLFYLLDIFNRRVDQLRAMAQSAVERDEHGSLLAQAVLNHLHREPIPSLSALLLISTILLGAGATIFALACPTRIKEFSRDQWRDQLGHSLIHYLPLSWRYSFWRVICVALYAVGSVGVVWVLAAKIWAALMFITSNS